MASKYRDNPPSSSKYAQPEGLTTNACPSMPNGMDFDKPEVEQYFTNMQKERWAEQDSADGYWSMDNYELRHRVESSRFLHRPAKPNEGGS